MSILDIFLIIFALAIAFFMVGLAIRAIFVAFVKKKDERSKWIVIKSMAHSFVVIAIFQTILLIFKFSNPYDYQIWWDSFTRGIYIEPAFINFMVLGIVLIVNTKKHGGSL